MSRPPDGRSPIALGYLWAARIFTVALEMVIPGLVGHWIDIKLDTGFVCLVLGLLAGMAFSTWHLLKLVQRSGMKER